MEEKNDTQSLQDLADKIRDCYFKYRVTNYNLSKRLNERFDKWTFWEAAALACMELNADPYDFIKAAFLHSINPKALLPQMLHGNKIKEWYKMENQVELSAVLDNVIKNDVLNACKNHNKGLKEVLEDETINIPAYIRYALIPENKTILEKFGRQAYKILIARPDLVNALKKILSNFSLQPLVTYLDGQTK
jgi:hypothetical protein